MRHTLQLYIKQTYGGGILKLLHVTIQTDKFEEEIMFYEKYIGLTIRQDMRPMGRNMVFLSDQEGDTNIEIIENTDAQPVAAPALSIGFRSADIDATRAQLADAGFEVSPFVTPMPDVKFFFVKDPAGVNVQIM